MTGGGAAIGDGRDTGLYRSGNRLKIRLAFDPAVQKEVIELAFPGVILKKAENQLSDQRRHKTGKDADQECKENIGGIMRHEIVPGEHHQQDPDRAGNEPALSAHEAEAGDTRGSGRHMSRGEGESVSGLSG